MKNRDAVVLAGFVALTVGGCDSLSGILDMFLPTTTRVRLVNNTGFAVEGTLYYGDQQDMPEDLLTTDLLATEVDFSLSVGADRLIITESCEDLQAIIIDDAELLLFPGISPDTSSDVLRDGEDFGCGDEIVFTFTLTPEFTVSATVR